MKIPISKFCKNFLFLASLSVCSCATQQPTMQPEPLPAQLSDVPVEYQEAIAPLPCKDLLPLMDSCVEHGTKKQNCEDAELHVYSRVVAQSNDQALARRAGNACLLSCQSGKLMLGDFEVAWREKFGGCQ